MTGPGKYRDRWRRNTRTSSCAMFWKLSWKHARAVSFGLTEIPETTGILSRRWR